MNPRVLLQDLLNKIPRFIQNPKEPTKGMLDDELEVDTRAAAQEALHREKFKRIQQIKHDLGFLDQIETKEEMPGAAYLCYAIKKIVEEGDLNYITAIKQLNDPYIRASMKLYAALESRDADAASAVKKVLDDHFATSPLRQAEANPRLAQMLELEDAISPLLNLSHGVNMLCQLVRQRLDNTPEKINVAAAFAQMLRIKRTAAIKAVDLFHVTLEKHDFLAIEKKKIAFLINAYLGAKGTEKSIAAFELTAKRVALLQKAMDALPVITNKSNPAPAQILSLLYDYRTEVDDKKAEAKRIILENKIIHCALIEKMTALKAQLPQDARLVEQKQNELDIALNPATQENDADALARNEKLRKLHNSLQRMKTIAVDKPSENTQRSLVAVYNTITGYLVPASQKTDISIIDHKIDRLNMSLQADHERAIREAEEMAEQEKGKEIPAQRETEEKAPTSQPVMYTIPIKIAVPVQRPISHSAETFLAELAKYKTLLTALEASDVTTKAIKNGAAFLRVKKVEVMEKALADFKHITTKKFLVNLHPDASWAIPTTQLTKNQITQIKDYLRDLERWLDSDYFLFLKSKKRQVGDTQATKPADMKSASTDAAQSETKQEPASAASAQPMKHVAPAEETTAPAKQRKKFIIGSDKPKQDAKLEHSSTAPQPVVTAKPVETKDAKEATPAQSLAATPLPTINNGRRKRIIGGDKTHVPLVTEKEPVEMKDVKEAAPVQPLAAVTPTPTTNNGRRKRIIGEDKTHAPQVVTQAQPISAGDAKQTEDSTSPRNVTNNIAPSNADDQNLSSLRTPLLSDVHVNVNTEYSYSQESKSDDLPSPLPENKSFSKKLIAALSSAANAIGRFFSRAGAWISKKFSDLIACCCGSRNAFAEVPTTPKFGSSNAGAMQGIGGFALDHSDNEASQNSTDGYVPLAQSSPSHSPRQIVARTESGSIIIPVRTPTRRSP